MATLQSVCQLTKVNRLDYFLAILLAIFLQIVTAGQAFSDGGHAGPPAASSNAHLPVLCMAHDYLLRQLQTRHGEEAVSGGLANGKQALLFINRETGSWTWLVRLSDIHSCILSAGDDWRNLPSSLTGEPS